MNKVAKIGFWGYPDPDVVKKVKSNYPNAEWIDLDIDFYYPKTNILPESYCKIIRNIIDNAILESLPILSSSIKRLKNFLTFSFLNVCSKTLTLSKVETTFI